MCLQGCCNVVQTHSEPTLIMIHNQSKSHYMLFIYSAHISRFYIMFRIKGAVQQVEHFLIRDDLVLGIVFKLVSISSYVHSTKCLPICEDGFYRAVILSYSFSYYLNWLMFHYSCKVSIHDNQQRYQELIQFNIKIINTYHRPILELYSSSWQFVTKQLFLHLNVSELKLY